MDKKIFLTPILLVAMITPGLVFAGTPQQNWQAGHDDGVIDCQNGNANAFNGHSNASHHSQSYIDGYNNGFNNCRSGTTVVTQNQAQYQNQNPNYSCFTLIGNCGAQSSAQNQEQGQ